MSAKNTAERPLSRDEMGKMRLKQLERELSYCYLRSEFYREKFNKEGIKPGDIRTWDDFRALPVLMTKDEERWSRDQSLASYGHPFGLHLCVPAEDIIVSKTTSGTTGTPTFSYSFTRRDVNRWNRLFARAMSWLVGRRPGDGVLNYFPLSGGGGASGGMLAGIFASMGVLSVDAGAEAPMQRVLDLMRLTRANVLMASPSFVDLLIDKYREATGREIGEPWFRKLLLSGEPGIAMPAVKKRVEGFFGGRWFDFMAPNGEGFSASCDSEQYHGLHEVAPEYSVCAEDLVGPVTRRPLDIKEGIVGEALLTSMGREGAPYIKYASGDVY